MAARRELLPSRPEEGAASSSAPRSEAGATDEWDIVDGSATDITHDEAATAGVSVFSDWPSEKVVALRNALTAAPWHEVRFQLRTVSNVLSGSEMVKWLNEQNFSATELEAVEIGNAMLARRFIFPMRKKFRDLGFRASPELFYSVNMNREERVSLLGLTKPIRSGGSGSPLIVRAVDYVSLGGEATEARIQERQRRSGGGITVSDGRWTTDKLVKADPKPWSMTLDDVPLPAVGDCSPDACEWASEWEIEVLPGQTDEEGWVYSTAFYNNAWSPLVAPNHHVRLRCWKRIARKSRAATGALGGPVLSETFAVLSPEEQAHRNLMERAAAALSKPPRIGRLEFTVLQGRAISCAKSSFLIAQFGTSVFRTVESRGHKWNFSAEAFGDLNSTALILKLYRSSIFGPPVLIGQAEFVAPERESAGIRYVPLHGGIVGKQFKGQTQHPSYYNNEVASEHGSRAEVGSTSLARSQRASSSTARADPAIQLEWCFKARYRDAADTDSVCAGTVNGAPPTSWMLSPTPVATQQCALHLTINAAEGLLINIGRPLTRAQRLCFCCPADGCCRRKLGAAPKAIVVVRYRGRYIDSVCRSPPVLLHRSPEWHWSVCLQVNHEWPVTLEVTRLDGEETTVIGRCTIDCRQVNTTVVKALHLLPPADADYHEVANAIDEQRLKDQGSCFRRLFSRRATTNGAVATPAAAVRRREDGSAATPLIDDVASAADDGHTVTPSIATDAQSDAARSSVAASGSHNLQRSSYSPRASQRRPLVVGTIAVEWNFEMKDAEV